MININDIPLDDGIIKNISITDYKVTFNTLMLRGSRVNNIRFTDAVRPRTGEVVPACKNCTSIFKEAFR